MNVSCQTNALSPHSAQFRCLTARLLLIFSSTSVIPKLSAEEIGHYAGLAVFHDIGKQAIPSAILNKPGKLTAEEFSVMKSHTTAGCALLERTPEFARSPDLPLICDVCRHHHERWDGGGYPDGLSGGQITPWVQVVGLADAFDALLHPRVYKPAFPQEQAAAMIASGACGAFDPRMLDCFCRNIGDICRAIY